MSNEGNDAPRIGAEDWRVIYRVFDDHVEVSREVDSDDVCYLEIVRDQILAELYDATQVDRERRVARLRGQWSSLSYPTGSSVGE